MKIRSAILTAALIAAVILVAAPRPVQAQDDGGARLADGWIAIGTGLTKPLSRPVDRVDDCWQQYDADDPISPYLVAAGCGVFGVGEGIVVGACNVVVGALDVVTFGLFELSRQSGVIE